MILKLLTEAIPRMPAQRSINILYESPVFMSMSNSSSSGYCADVGECSSEVFVSNPSRGP